MMTLQEHRVRGGFTVRSLAEAAGVAPRTIVQAEKGRQVPRPETMWQIANALGTRPLCIREFAQAVGYEPPAPTP